MPAAEAAALAGEKPTTPAQQLGGAAGGNWLDVAPTGWVTIVLCDVQQASQLWRDCHAEMKEAVERYCAEAQSLLAEHSGYLCQRNDDTFMCAFTSAIEASNWCFALQIRLLSLQHASDPLLRHPAARWEQYTGQGDPDGGPGADCTFRGLRVRMGMHVGKPYFEADKATGHVQYYGPVVQICARLASIAHGGQIVISQKAYQEIAPYCWPDDENPLLRPPAVQLLGWRQVRSGADAEFDAVETIQLFQLLPLSLAERTFPGLPRAHEARLKPVYERMIEYAGGGGDAALSRNKDNANLAVKARLEMLQRENEQLCLRIEERDRALARYAEQTELDRAVTKQLHADLARTCERADAAQVEIAELKADHLLDAEEAEQRLRIRIQSLEAEIEDLRSKECEYCGNPLDDEMPLSTGDKRVVVLTGLQSSVALIYQAVLPTVFADVERVECRWTDTRAHRPGVMPTAHLHFATEERANAAARGVAGKGLFQSGQLIARVVAGDARIAAWEQQQRAEGAAADGASPPDVMSPRNHRRQSIAKAALPPVPETPREGGDLLDRAAEGGAAMPALHEAPPTPALDHVPAMPPPGEAWAAGGRGGTSEELTMKLTLLQTHNMRMRQILVRFVTLAKQFVNAGARTIEREWWGSVDPTDDDPYDAERDDEAFDAMDESTAGWVRATQEALQKRSANQSPWAQQAGDLLQLLNTVRRFVMSSKTMARRQRGAGGAVAAPSGLAPDGGGGGGAGGGDDAVDRVQQAMSGFLQNVSGTRSVGVQCGQVAAEAQHCGVQTEKLRLVPLPPPGRRPRVWRGSNVRRQGGDSPPPSPRAPAAAAMGLAPPPLSPARMGYSTLRALQEQLRHVDQQQRSPAAAADAAPAAPDPCGGTGGTAAAPPPPAKERWIRELRLRASRGLASGASPGAGCSTDRATGHNGYRRPRPSVRLPRMSPQ